MLRMVGSVLLRIEVHTRFVVLIAIWRIILQMSFNPGIMVYGKIFGH